MSLVDEINRQNPQWRGEELAQGTVDRSIERDIRDEIDEDIITAVTGMRRVGKTTLLYRLIDDLSEGDKSTFYYSFDIEKAEVKELLDTFFREIIQTTPENLDRKIYIFLDEVQKIQEWSDHVKAYQDSYENLKFFVTGSSSANIRKGSGESLVGRISLHHLTPFTFREYLRAKDVKMPEKNFNELPFPGNSAEIKARLPEYLESGGFPGLMDEASNKKQERLKDILDLTLYRDVVEIFDIGRPELLEAIFRSVVSQSGNTANYNKLARNLDAQYRTVRKYVDALEQSFLIEKSRRFQNNTLQEYKKRPKLYAGEHSFCSLENTKEGLRAETVAYNHLKTLGETGYWKGNGEVDIVLKRESLEAYEIKYQNNPEAGNLAEFRDNYPDSETYLVVRDQLDREQGIIPLWLLLLHI